MTNRVLERQKFSSIWVKNDKSVKYLMNTHTKFEVEVPTSLVKQNKFKKSFRFEPNGTN